MNYRVNCSKVKRGFYSWLIILIVFSLIFNLQTISYAATELSVESIAVSAGRDHSTLLLEDGTLLTWGGNYDGQLGNGDKTDVSYPTQIDTIKNIKAVAASIEYTVALKKDGTVWAWGINEYGQLGNGTTQNSYSPVQVSGLNNIIAIAAGGTHALALGSDRKVYAWGRNFYGQIGAATKEKVQETPVKVTALNNVIAIAAGERHSMALKSDGTVWTWGDNDSYQLGVSTYQDGIPVQVSGLTNIKAISAGSYHSIAVKEDGGVYVWGYNASGQLGTGTIKDVKIPVKLTSLSNIKSAAAGNSHTLFLKTDGTVWASGYNIKGQLGTGNKDESLIPIKINALEDIISISTKDSHNLVIKKDGTVLAWGYNVYGQIGDGTFDNALYPLEILTSNTSNSTTSTSTNTSFNLSAVSTESGIVLNWDSIKDSNIAGYHVFRAKVSGGYEIPRTDFMIKGNTFTDNDVEENTTYYYAVAAILDSGKIGAVSNEVSVTASMKNSQKSETGQKVTIVLQLGNRMMKVNGVDKEVDPGKGTAPVEIGGRTMIPIRTVVEELGGTLKWVESEEKIIISLGEKNVELWLNKKIIKVNGVELEIDVAPQISNDRTMVPVRFVTANLGCELQWDDVNKKVTIIGNVKNNRPSEEVKASYTPYWVENTVRLVSGGEIVFEDNEGIYEPIFSKDGEKVIYSNGDNKLLLYSVTSGEKKIIYEYNGSSDYRVYPVGWSSDNKKVALLTSHSGGFIGGNKLITLEIDTSIVTVIASALESADWSIDGRFVINDSSDVKILDQSGKLIKKLKTPEMRAFFNASNPTFSPDGKSVIYNCGEDYYLHDIEKDVYKKIFEVRIFDGAARISYDGRIIVSDKGEIYIYNISDKSYKVYYDKAKSSSPNWLRK